MTGPMLLADSRPTVGDLDIPELVVDGRHPIVNELTDKTQFAVSVFTHHDHSHIAYEGSTFDPGPNGQVLIRNAFGDPVVLAGQVGKGHVVFSGFHYGRGTSTDSADHHIYEEALRWLARVEGGGEYGP